MVAGYKIEQPWSYPKLHGEVGRSLSISIFTGNKRHDRKEGWQVPL